ncbi:hypothetical protein Btru_063571 [Bulinus truncatus]|nr:hypothetical protein Btru_063571 [Bulinus truncatus]
MLYVIISDQHYRCQSGVYILSKYRCNGYPDCAVTGDDEIGCEERCDPPNKQCSNGRCINAANVCDHFCDCQLCEDEEGCNNTYCDLTTNIICLRANRCLPSKYICDGHDHCMDKNVPSDENFCSKSLAECSASLKRSNHFYPEDQLILCSDGRCMLNHHKCNHFQECFGGEDEANCTFKACAGDEFTCESGDCVKKFKVCDNVKDCKDWSDEKNCSAHNTCQVDYKQCSSGHCIPGKYWCDHWPDCRDGSDEVGCIYRTCSSDEFTCSNGECVPLSMHCYNGITGNNMGCRDKSNLLNCSQHNCLDPQTQFKCQKSFCIDNSQLCNNKPDCIFNYYDETNCTYPCPYLINICKCKGQEMFCDHRSLTQLVLPTSHESINKLSYQGNKLGLNLTSDSFSTGQIPDKVIYLDLSYQKITKLNPFTFVGLDSLRMLNLSGNELKNIEDGTFYGLNNLLTLDISNNKIQNIGKRVFYNLPKLSFLITDKFKFCCLAKSVQKCLPEPDEFSSCGHLMDNYVLRIFIWLLGFIAFFGNVVVIAWRIRGMRGRKNFYGRSGVCLALHITPQRPPGWQFSVAIFLVLNFASFLIIALSYVWMFLVARETRSAVRSIETKNDTAMAKRMTLIVMTDFACWIPIIILGFVSLAGGNASNDVSKTLLELVFQNQVFIL